MRFRHLAEQIYFRPWFITPQGHASIRLVFERALATGLTPPATAEELRISDLFPQRRPLAIDDQGIASIHILGPIGKGLSKLEQSCGATGIEQIRADYSKALDKGATGILLDFDSPGGTITGVPELAGLIAQKPVPTVAYTEDMMASAAYYLAAGATAIVASPSASVGSIGVYIPWMDTSARYEQEGMKPDPIVNTGGDLKAMGFGGKLTEAQRAHLQAEVDADFAQFKNHVRNFRLVADTAMRGQVMNGHAANAANLVDYTGDRAKAVAVLKHLSAGNTSLAA